MFAASTFKDKRVAMFGLARSGISCALALQDGGAMVFAWDDSEPAQEKARAEGVNVTNLHTEGSQFVQRFGIILFFVVGFKLIKHLFHDQRSLT